MIKNVDTSIIRDLPEYSVILHQVNCHGHLQTGLATQLSKNFNDWFEDYHGYCRWFIGHTDEILGTFHRKEYKDKKIIICSVFCQEGGKHDFFGTNLEAWDAVLRKILRQTKVVNASRKNKWTIHIMSNIGASRKDAVNTQLMELFEKYFGKAEDADVWIHSI